MKKKNQRLAVIDLGTNSFHMIIAELHPRNHTFTILDKEKDYVRIGSGKSDMKQLSPSAMERGIMALRRFKGLAQRFQAPVRAVATSAIREALNQQEYLLRVRRVTGINIEVISGFEEVRLIYLGVLKALPVFGKRVLLVDIGGGSTDFLLARRDTILYDNTLKIGALRLHQRFFAGKKITDVAIDKCRKYIRGTLNPVTRKIRRQRFDVAVGTSGTVETIANMIRIRRGLDSSYKMNSFTFNARELTDVVLEIVGIRDARKRARLPGLDADRADIIVSGGLILEQVIEDLGIKRMTVSEYALREGVVIDTMNRATRTPDVFDDIKQKSVSVLAAKFQYSRMHAEHTAMLAIRIFTQTRRLHGLGSREREFLEVAALLHDIGFYISHAQHHRHTYYLIRNAELLGFTEEEKEIIANVARYHRKSHPKQKHEAFVQLTPDNQQLVRKLAAILRVADGLDRSHTCSVRDVVVRIRQGKVCLVVRPSGHADVSLELWGAVRKKRLFEEMYGCDLQFRVLVKK
jgi:exopolyphosphatase/guanosine-5'-triphosphate,3'-diphosphate pyrophosphatase